MQNLLAVVSLKRIIHNTKLVLSRANVPLYAVVKDDAYGHGIEAVSLAIEPYVLGFSVAEVLEGVSLRVAGILKEILVLSPCLCEEEAALCLYHDLTPSISSFEALELFFRTAEKLSKEPKVQLKINTGMNRYGFSVEEVKKAIERIKSFGGTIEGVYSHLFAPDRKALALSQRELFLRASALVLDAFPNAVRHLASTGGVLAGEEFCFDAVRCGIALYGYLPAPFQGAMEVLPAMKLFASSAQNLTFIGGGLGYGKAEKEYKNLTTFRLGYGDGFCRKDGKASLLCMDAEIEEGFYPFGTRKLILSNFEEYASSHGTIVYDALVSLTKKAEKYYVR